MRVLMLSRDPAHVGGVVTMVAQWKACMPADVEIKDFRIGERRGSGLVISRVLRPLVDAAKLSLHLWRNDYDLVHVNPSFELRSVLRDGLFMLILRLYQQRVLVYFHGWNVRLSETVFSNPLYRFLFRISFGYARMTAVLAGSFKQQLDKAGYRSSAIFRATTMFDGNALENVHDEPNRDSSTILFLSRMVTEKGVNELMRAFMGVCGNYRDAHLIMAGDGPARSELESFVSNNGLGDRVEFTGYVHGEDKLALFGRASIFVLPSYSEGCPVSVLEAMAAGLAVVSTGVGAVPDILRDGINGCLLESHEPRLIEQALNTLLSDVALVKSMSEKNVEYAWSHFESKIVTDDLVSHYREILKT